MEIERNLKLVSTRRRRFSLSRYMGWLRYIASLPRVCRIAGVHDVTNSTSLDAKRSSLFKNIKMGTTTSICPVICFVFFCIFNGISSKEEKRAKKDTVIMVSLDGMGWQPGGGYSHTLPIRVCAAQRGRDFEAPDLERGIHFRGVF